MAYSDLKEHNGNKYTGMPVGGKHHWEYPDGKWEETKISPDEWQFRFIATKGRFRPAPIDSGAKRGTEYHWYIIADQKAVKLNTDQYQTVMEGSKFKVGHKRPQWRGWSYDYPEQVPYRQRLIHILQETLQRLESEEAGAQVQGARGNMRMQKVLT